MIIEDAGIEKGNNMRILYFSQFYTPESIAPSFRATENSKIWTNSGHEVTVFYGISKITQLEKYLVDIRRNLYQEKK